MDQYNVLLSKLTMVPVLSVPLPFGCSTLLPACLESLEPLLLLCCLLVNPFFLTIHVSIVIGDQLRLFNHAAELQRGKNLNNKLSSDSLLTST